MEEKTENFLYRTVVVNPRQSKKLSLKTRKIGNFQTYFFNKGVESGLVEKYDKYKISYTITDFHNTMPWSNKFHTDVARTAFQQGYDSADKHLKSCAKKRKIRIWGKKTSGKNHNWHKAFDNIKPNKWIDKNDLFRDSKNMKYASIAVNGKHPSLRMGKWRTLYMNLPGIGQVELLTSLKKLPEHLIHQKDKNSSSKFYQTNIVSYRLVENTKKITAYTNDSNRTFEIHLTLRVSKPKNTDRTKVVGIDRGVKKSIVTYDGTKTDFHRTPDNCMRQKNDEITQQQRIRDGHKLHSNRWKKEDRKLESIRETVNNKKTEHERYLAKLLVMNSGVIVMERLDIGSMTKSEKWNSGLNRKIYGAGMGRMGERIKLTAENMGVKTLEIVPHYTSITCSRCNLINRNSRTVRDIFQCVYCGFLCDADKNASINIRHYGFPCIRRLPLIDKYGNYKCNSMENVISANKNIISNNVIISGGGDHRHKTGGSKHGLYRAVSEKNGNNQAVEDLFDCQKKTCVP